MMDSARELLDRADAALVLGEAFTGPAEPTRWEWWQVRWLPRWAIRRNVAEKVARRQDWYFIPRPKRGDTVRFHRPVYYTP